MLFQITEYSKSFDLATTWTPVRNQTVSLFNSVWRMCGRLVGGVRPKFQTCYLLRVKQRLAFCCSLLPNKLFSVFWKVRLLPGVLVFTQNDTGILPATLIAVDRLSLLLRHHFWKSPGTNPFNNFSVLFVICIHLNEDMDMSDKINAPKSMWFYEPSTCWRMK